MRNVLKCVRDVKSSDIRAEVERRIREFRAVRRKGRDAVFKELCFCILTANYNAEGGIRIQKAVGDGFLTLSEKPLAARLKKLGHRFPNTRAKYIVEARKHKDALHRNMHSMDEHALRDWIVANVKGLGYKEASHFMRNVGYGNVAIIDFHIIDFLEKQGMIERPKTLTPRKYLEVESALRKVASRSGMDMGELDLYMWYCETGKVLK